MLIIGENLKQLVHGKNICGSALVEKFSLRIKLGSSYYKPHSNTHQRVTYNNYPDPKDLYTERQHILQNLELNPGESVIGSSHDLYKMPLDHFGLVQTKGTLARMFVQITCNDGQIEPGFSGYITLEITNFSPWTVLLPKFSNVGQLFVFRTSTDVEKGYEGRYSKAAMEGPTIPIFREEN